MKWDFHPEALEEYREATLYYADRDPTLALRFVEAVEEAIGRILESPRTLANPRGGCPSLSHPRLSLRSSVHDRELHASIEVASEKIADRTPILGNPDMTLLGNAVHAFLGCDLGRVSQTQKEEIATDLLNGYGVGGSIQPSDLVVLADRFKAFAENRWPNARLYREWPISMRFDGYELHGTADLVVEAEDGYVILDHKTFPGGEKELVEKAKTFAAQLAAYKEALLVATGGAVISTMIHFPVSGFLAEVRLD